jgi:hypothetical protein
MSLTLLHAGKQPSNLTFADVSGYVYAWSKDGAIFGAGVPGVVITMTGSQSATRTTDANGFFDFGTVVVPFTLTPSKAEVNITTGNYVSRLAELGINSSDEAALTAHLNATIPQIGYGLIACDLNTSLSITSADRANLSQLLTGIVTAINSYNPPTGGNIQKFVDGAYAMPANPWSPMYPSTITVNTGGTVSVSFVMVTKGNIV